MNTNIITTTASIRKHTRIFYSEVREPMQGYPIPKAELIYLPYASEILHRNSTELETDSASPSW